jgi:hypothetical protein
VRAIAHAQTVLSWQEVLTEDEMPPEWMWPFDEELESWFEDVERKRKERYGNRGDDADSSGPMTENEYAKGMR